jgi:hypothetical protein
VGTDVVGALVGIACVALSLWLFGFQVGLSRGKRARKAWRIVLIPERYYPQQLSVILRRKGRADVRLGSLSPTQEDFEDKLATLMAQAEGKVAAIRAAEGE